MKGMSDWSLCELEDIDWNEFGKTDDHIVPHRGGSLVHESVALSDACKKPRHEVQNDVRKNMCGRGSATKTLLRRKEEIYFTTPMKDASSSILEGSRSHASEIVVPASCDPEHVAHVTALASQDARISDNCVKDCYIDTNKNKICSEDPGIGTMVSSNGSKACHFSLENVSPDVTDLPFLENEHKDRENDLIYYDWPEIGNFEDIDIMFRNWDSSFGQGHTDTADELSWIPSSSHAIYGSETTFEPGLQSSCSELSALNSASEHHCASSNFLPENNPTTADRDKPSGLGYQSYAHRLDTNDENKGNSALKEEVCHGRDEIRTLAPTQISENGLNGCEAPNMINIHIKLMGSQNTSEEKRMKRVADQKLLDSDIPAPQTYYSQQLPKQHLKGSASSSYIHTLNSHAQLKEDLPTHQVPFTQTTSYVDLKNETEPSSSYKAPDHIVNYPTRCMERLPDKFTMPQTMAPDNFEKLHGRQQLCDSMTVEHPHQKDAFRSKASAQKKHHKFRHQTGGDSKLEDISVELPTVEIVSSIVQESSCLTSDSISLEAASFRQLQDVMHQLDVRTKLCIRDSLYRLARSAKQRHTSAHTNNSSRESSYTRGIQGEEASKKYADLMDAETDTNPIDRSVAHLLFHKPSNPATRSAAAATSLESHIINKQLHVSIGKQT